MSHQFAKRSTQPLRPDSYAYCARRLRALADQIEARGNPSNPRELGSLTKAVYSASRFALAFAERHRAQWGV